MTVAFTLTALLTATLLLLPLSAALARSLRRDGAFPAPNPDTPPPPPILDIYQSIYLCKKDLRPFDYAQGSEATRRLAPAAT
jgi:hypothetical protein